MDIALIVVLPMLVIIGSICGLVALVKLKDLQRRLHVLEKAARVSMPQAATVTQVKPEPQSRPRPEAGRIRSGDEESPPLPAEANATAIVEEPVSPTGVSKPMAGIDWYELLKQYWMVLLGGVSLVLAGIFLVRYSIEHGILGPTARFVLGLLFGAALVAGGEWLRRSNRLAAGVHAVLAASGVLVIYSVMLVGLHIYDLISVRFTFVSLALISALSMLLSLKHGPLTAGMGLLGAYLVPILVSTGSNNIEAALLYILVVASGSLWLQRYIYRPWLWWGTWLGVLAWFVISLDMPDQAQGLRAVYIAALAYLGTALPFTGLRLSRIDHEALAGRDDLNQLTLVFLGFTIAVIVLLRIENLNELSYPAITLLPIVAMLVARNNLPLLEKLPLICLLPFAIDLFSLDVSFIDWEIVITPMVEALRSSYITMLIVMVVAAIVVGGHEVRRGSHAGYWAAIALFVPLAAILLAYTRISGFEGGLEWGVPTATLGLLYAFMLELWRKRKAAAMVEAALAIASQVAISLACFMVFSGVTLTLVLAIQLVGLALIGRKLDIEILPLIMKILLAVIVVRLTANPWIFIYDVSSEVIVLTYAGSLVACYATSRIMQSDASLTVWLHSASAHLLVLLLAVVTRYFVYDGDIFVKSFNLTEASIYLCSWCAIGLVYYWKAGYLEHHRSWYQMIAFIHVVASTILYVFYNLLLHNPLWSHEAIATTPVFNLLIIGYGLPVVLAVMVYKRMPIFGRVAGLVALVGLFVFVTLETRHLWNGGIDPSTPVLQGELYTYSLIWLLLSVAILVYGAYRNYPDMQKAGMATLVLVVAKVFLWDMEGLDGLWRVVSFLGLGLCLLGVAYLFNRVKTSAMPGANDTQ